MQRRGFLVLGATMTLALALGRAGRLRAQGLGVTGSYRVAGRNPDGSSYSGVARIVQIGDRVNMTWELTSGQTYRGEGAVDGDRLVIDWGSDAPIVYNISDPGRLVGVWAGGNAAEILTLLP